MVSCRPAFTSGLPFSRNTCRAFHRPFRFEDGAMDCAVIRSFASQAESGLGYFHDAGRFMTLAGGAGTVTISYAFRRYMSGGGKGESDTAVLCRAPHA